MELKKLILNQITKKGHLKTAEITKISGFSRAYVNRFLKQLQEEGEIALIGKANKALYVKAEKNQLDLQKSKILSARKRISNKNISEDLVLDEIQKNTGIFLDLPKNTERIVSYAFTEMLNNAIEHSRSEFIEIFMEKTEEKIRFDVTDHGVGIFRNIQNKKKLASELEAIQDLLKGKQTTMPERHSGEGIFFTSKAADVLTIKSFRKKLVFNNIVSDVFIEDLKEFIGTRVTFVISEKTSRDLKKIFDRHTDEFFKFSKTKVIVKLHKMGTEYLSRSQARRITVGLENFKTIILNFKDVKTVGQAFADEIFRVWKSKNPNIEIVSESANENIMFMVNRAQGEHYSQFHGGHIVKKDP